MDLVGYLRRSQIEDEGAGFEVQREQIQAWADRAGHCVIKWCEDRASGADANRPGLAEATGWPDVDGLVVWRLDRLARDVVLQEVILKELWGRGRQFFSATEEHLSGDPTRNLVRQLLGVIAEYERAVVTLRLQSGRQMKDSRGGYAYGAPPYGYEAKDKALVPVPHEQEVIRQVKQMRAEGLAYTAIAGLLTIPPRRGTKWYASTIRNIANRPLREDLERESGRGA